MTTQTLIRTPSTVAEEGDAPIAVRFEPAVELTDEQFALFCEQNREARIERTADGVVEFMPPVKGDAGSKELEIGADLKIWTRMDSRGVAFGSNAGFTLPNGAVRSPDASWVLKSRLAALSDEDKDRFIPICPDFVVELRSPSDRLSVLQAKMDEYMANGARLGWLIDPLRRSVHIYRPQAQTEILENPESLSGAPELPGFTLDLKPIWEPAF